MVVFSRSLIVVLFIIIVITILIIVLWKFCSRVVCVARLGRITLVGVFSSPLEVGLRVEVVVFPEWQLVLLISLIKVVVEGVIVVPRLPVEVFRVVGDHGLLLFLFRPAVLVWG